MKIPNQFNIDIEIDKYPILMQGRKRYRGEDSIIISIDDVMKYDTDLLPGGKDLRIHLSNNDALELIRQLTVCIGKNVDAEFKKTWPDVAPF